MRRAPGEVLKPMALAARGWKFSDEDGLAAEL